MTEEEEEDVAKEAEDEAEECRRRGESSRAPTRRRRRRRPAGNGDSAASFVADASAADERAERVRDVLRGFFIPPSLVSIVFRSLLSQFSRAFCVFGSAVARARISPYYSWSLRDYYTVRGCRLSKNRFKAGDITITSTSGGKGEQNG